MISEAFSFCNANYGLETLFCFGSLFVRVEVLAVILGLVIILDGKLGAAVQVAQAHGTVLTT